MKALIKVLVLFVWLGVGLAAFDLGFLVGQSTLIGLATGLAVGVIMFSAPDMDKEK